VINSSFIACLCRQTGSSFIIKKMSFLRLIRFPNLIIVALTQYLLQYAILIPELEKVNQKPLLPHFPFFLLVFSTVLIAAGGYIINDIEDVEIDKLNKPIEKQIVGRVYPLNIAWLFYGITTLVGFIISLYLAFYIHDFLQLVIYPLAVGLLWAYSRWLKRLPLIGNLVVAFFCAFVAWVVLYAEMINPSNTQLEATSNAFSAFLGYAFLAFISTLFREIIKDIEDAEGDKAQNCKTLPILLGTKMSKGIALGVGLLFLALVFYFNFMLKDSILKVVVLNITISLPIIYALFLLIKAKEKQEFSYLSKLAKVIMLSGLIFLLIMKL
jgi:4-hydroxybenzoate polyprenyltransferase